MTLKELEDRRAQLVLEVKTIQAQLGQTRRFDVKLGRELSRVEYSRWRNKALQALAEKEKALLNYTKTLREERAKAAVGVTDFDPSSANGVLSATYVLLRRLVDEGVDLDPDEFKVMDAARDYLRNARVIS